MNIHKNEMLWYNARYCIRASYERSQSMEYCCSAKEWRIGEPKSKSGYRTIPSTEEAVTILKNKKKRIRGFQKFQQDGEDLCFCVEKEQRSRTVHMI